MDNKKATLELGTQPIGKLLIQYATPGIIAMVASSLYNIIDRIFIGQIVGPLAISGLAITFPFMNLTGAFGAGIGVGSSNAISLKLGQKDYKTAERIFGNTISLNLIIGLSVGAICLVLLDPILRFFGASDATIPYARSFMQIILAGNVFSHMYLGMNAVLRAASKPKMAMKSVIFTVVMNVFLDMVFIWWLHFGIRALTPQERNLQTQFETGKDDSINRDISLLDECIHVHCRNYHEQSTCQIWWRPCSRLIRYCQWYCYHIRYDCNGHQPRDATHCRI